MELQRIQELIEPFVPAPLASTLLLQLQQYLDLLLRWNQRLNLTAIRDPEQIVTRHFGESLFAAQVWVGSGPVQTAIDVGSGAGFPGIPLKLYAPGTDVTLIEAHGKKATFLREVIRAVNLRGVHVVSRRAEDVGGDAETKAELVTLRAVEEFRSVLPIAARLIVPGGRLGLLVGARQVETAAALLPDWQWAEAVAVPRSDARVVLTGRVPE